MIILILRSSVHYCINIEACWINIKSNRDPKNWRTVAYCWRPSCSGLFRAPKAQRSPAEGPETLFCWEVKAAPGESPAAPRARRRRSPDTASAGGAAGWGRGRNRRRRRGRRRLLGATVCPAPKRRRHTTVGKEGNEIRQTCFLSLLVPCVSSSTVQRSTHQGESGDCKEHFKAAVDEEGAEQAQAVVSQVFERQLKDVTPADTAKVNLFCRAVRRAAQHKELWVHQK